MRGMSEPTTNRRSILAAGIAALFGFAGAKAAPVKEVWEHSVTTSDIITESEWMEAELESGGDISPGTYLASDESGRAIPWQPGLKQTIFGVAIGKAKSGEKFNAAVMNFRVKF